MLRIMRARKSVLMAIRVVFDVAICTYSLITNIDPTDPKATKDAKVSSKSSATSAEVSKSQSSKAATEEKVKKIVTVEVSEGEEQNGKGKPLTTLLARR